MLRLRFEPRLKPPYGSRGRAIIVFFLDSPVIDGVEGKRARFVGRTRLSSLVRSTSPRGHIVYVRPEKDVMGRRIVARRPTQIHRRELPDGTVGRTRARGRTGDIRRDCLILPSPNIGRCCADPADQVSGSPIRRTAGVNSGRAGLELEVRTQVIVEGIRRQNIVEVAR